MTMYGATLCPGKSLISPAPGEWCAAATSAATCVRLRAGRLNWVKFARLDSCLLETVEEETSLRQVTCQHAQL